METDKISRGPSAGGPAGPSKPLATVQPLRRDPASSYSYQQVNCLDSIIRFVAVLSLRTMTVTFDSLVVFADAFIQRDKINGENGSHRKSSVVVMVMVVMVRVVVKVSVCDGASVLGVCRYLDSCNIPNTVKRKCGSSSCTTSSTSDDDKQRELSGGAKGTFLLKEKEGE